MGTVVLPGKPHPKQEEFFRANARHIAFGGSRGGGKSWAMRRKMVLRRLNYPNSKGLLLRRTYPELYQNHVLPLLEELGDLARYRQQEHMFEFPNGSRLFLGYCDAETDVLRYQGQEYDDVGLEEATQFTEYQFQFIKTCNRNVRTDIKPRMYYTANPGGVGHGWFKRLFVDRNFLPNEEPSDYLFIQATVYDNPTLMNTNPEYVRELESLPDDMRKAFLYGDWDVFSGQVFSEFRRGLHVIEPFEIPAYWPKWLANDPGYADHCAWYWMAADEEGRIYVYREYTNADEDRIPYSEQAAKVAQMSAGEDIAYCVTGMDAFNRHPETGESIVDYYRKGGLNIPFLEPIHGQDSRKIRTGITHEYLHVYKDENTGKETAKLKIFDNCKKLVETLPQLISDVNNMEVPMKCGIDHWYDALSYGLASWTIKASAPEAARKKAVHWALRTEEDNDYKGGVANWLRWQ